MSYTKVLWGLLLSFLVGFFCRLTQIPAPSPPVLSGAFLVFTMSSGYWLVGRYLEASKRASAKV
jgi:XapX domain-containing protein